MRISAISDVHIKRPHDDADQLLMSFLKHPLVGKSDYILLLGDIFDLMCGPHQKYLEDYAHIFDQINELVKQGKRVHFIEGNHDVHLEKLFLRYWTNGEVLPKQSPVLEEIAGKKYYFSHGDEHDIDNDSYHQYKSLILSSPLRVVANYLMPYEVLHFIGEKASNLSRKKGRKSFDEEKVRLKFREGVETVVRGSDLDFVIGGHSHVKDDFLMSNNRTRYLNNGYALKTKTFITISDHQVEFIALDEI
jgi:UDP-2,3-diacylglucosamine hydrolase